MLDALDRLHWLFKRSLRRWEWASRGCRYLAALSESCFLTPNFLSGMWLPPIACHELTSTIELSDLGPVAYEVGSPRWRSFMQFYMFFRMVFWGSKPATELSNEFVEMKVRRISWRNRWARDRYFLTEPWVTFRCGARLIKWLWMRTSSFGWRVEFRNEMSLKENLGLLNRVSLGVILASLAPEASH